MVVAMQHLAGKSNWDQFVGSSPKLCFTAGCLIGLSNRISYSNYKSGLKKRRRPILMLSLKCLRKHVYIKISATFHLVYRLSSGPMSFFSGCGDWISSTAINSVQKYATFGFKQKKNLALKEEEKEKQPHPKTC